MAGSQLSASPFFRLPLEVRRIIYMQVLGGQRLHIVRKHKRLRFLKCRAPSLEECPTPKCLGRVDGEGVWTGGFSGKERTDGGVLDLLLVCRRVGVCDLLLRLSITFSNRNCLQRKATKICPSALCHGFNPGPLAGLQFGRGHAKPPHG